MLNNNFSIQLFFLLQKDAYFHHDDADVFFLILLQKYFDIFHVLLFQAFLRFFDAIYLAFLYIQTKNDKEFLLVLLIFI